ncbi:MAG: TPM domain-containing protein [Candidatus Margulisiibacteriota bacterium]|jgi:uncharacterized protein
MFKRFLFIALILSFFTITAANYPNYVGFVNDYAKVLTQKEIADLNILSQELEQKTGIELVSVIIKDLGDESIEEYANNLFSAWKIGKKGKDNGILFITALDNKKTRIEVGYGLEGILPDGKTGSILSQYVLPYFKVGNINQGLVNGHAALAYILAKENGVVLNQTLAVQPQNEATAKNSAAFFIKVIFVVIFLLLLFGFGGNNWMLLPLLLLGSGNFNSRDFGGFGGGGGSGFGGFGGGFSGGGGASGGW